MEYCKLLIRIIVNSNYYYSEKDITLYINVHHNSNIKFEYAHLTGRNGTCTKLEIVNKVTGK